jgi:hypothetical protein
MKEERMTENAKIARLWSNFHRLSNGHKKLVLKITETIAKSEKSVPEKSSVKKS